MTPENREALRVAILMILNQASKDRGMPLRGYLGLGVGLRMASASYAELPYDALDSEVEYLAGKGFAERVQRAISPENKHYRITSAGRDFLAEAGLQ